MEITKSFIEFDCAIGSDVSCMLYLLKHYNNPKYIKDFSGLLRLNSIEIWKNLAVSRTDHNPIKQLMKEGYESSADDIYKQLLENHAREIYEESPMTEILRFLNTSIKYENWKTSCTILCENDIQANIIKKVSPLSYIIFDASDLSSYDAIYIDSYDNLLNKYKNFEGKALHISEKLYNFDQQTLATPAKILPIILDNHMVFRVIAPYEGIQLLLNLDGSMLFDYDLAKEYYSH